MAMLSVDQTMGRPQDYASDGTDAIGFVQFWGNSPALDLVEDAQAAAIGPAAIGTSPGQQFDADGKPTQQPRGSPDEKEAAEHEGEESEDDAEYVVVEEKEDADPEPAKLPEGDDFINILVTGGCDIRHLTKTVSRNRGKDGKKLRFFLHESHHEALARHILFLQIINNKALPVRERMEIFLSLHGNALVREKDQEYLHDITAELIELVTDNSMHPLTKIVDLSHLKFKDRDVLQDIIKGWFKDVPFDVEQLREQRMRGYYRERYDFRKNLMDFDYQTHIKEKAGIINWFHYKEFCHTGVAFETRIGSYSCPNRTLASYTEAKDRKKGTTVMVRGFWADIVNSPYHTFGTAAHPLDKPRLFKIGGSMYKHTETDIAEFNMLSYLSQMETGEPMHLPPEKPEEHVFPYTSPLEELRTADSAPKVVEVKEEEEKKAEAPPPSRRGRRAPKKVDWPPLNPAFEDGGVEVVLLAGDLREVLRKSRYRGMFHRAFVGAMGVMPLWEEMGITSAAEDPFRPPEGQIQRIRKPPRKEAPELLGKKRAESTMASAMADGAVIVCETMKYQAHFDSKQRLAFRHRMAQVGHLAGWRLMDEKHAVPRMEHDMKERRAGELEKDAADFLRFVVMPGPPAAA